MRQEFTKATKASAFLRAAGRCECGCGMKIQGTPEYDHAIACALGGDNSLENCRVLDPKCHRRKTSAKDVPAIAKNTRTFENQRGLRDKRRSFKGSRKFNGDVTWRT